MSELLLEVEAEEGPPGRDHPDTAGEALVIETRELGKHYGDALVAVDRLTMRVRRGEVYGFLGPKGEVQIRRTGLLATLSAPSERGERRPESAPPPTPRRYPSMRTQPTPIRSADTVDVDALAGAIKIDVLQAAAEALVLGIDWCENEHEHLPGLSQVERIKLVEAQLDCFQGIEQKIRAELERTIPASVHWRSAPTDASG
jgi:hypothetical protein